MCVRCRQIVVALSNQSTNSAPSYLRNPMKISSFKLCTALSVAALPAVVLATTSAHAANAQQVNACASQMTERNITDNKSAKQFCTCVLDEQAKITQAQKNELDEWVQSGKDVRQNKTFQTISLRMKACGDGIKFNRPNANDKR
mgnify:CR=1 FL=1